MSLYQQIKKQSRHAVQAVRQAFRAKLSGLNAKNPVQLAQLAALAGETLQAVELMQQFGMTSSPPDGSECIVLPLGGKSVHSVIVATEHGAYRIAVNQGETCVYNQWGAKIALLKERIVEIDCDHLRIKAKESMDVQTKKYTETATESASRQSPSQSFGGLNGKTATATMNANIEQTGWHTSTGDQKAGGISQIGHVHPENDHGGPTDPPL